MGLFHKMKEPIFLRESNRANIQLETLKKLEPSLNEEGKAIIRQDIKCLEYGILGEKNIAYELKNSHMPMYILHDIYLEDGDLSAQIDYLVFTKKLCFIIECKNLYGNIEINSQGQFSRTMEFGKKVIQEGIYSPFTQNQHHLELMKKLTLEYNKKNLLTHINAEHHFDTETKPIVVLANPKTILNAKYAKKDIKEHVLRGDQLIHYIKETYQQSKISPISDDKLLAKAQFYLTLHTEIEKDYTDKYAPYKMNVAEIQPEFSIINTNKNLPVEETPLYQELKAYRLEKSHTEQIKPFFIYTDKQMKDLISSMPESKADLLEVAGFGEVKVQKYGNDILAIIAKHRRF